MPFSGLFSLPDITSQPNFSPPPNNVAALPADSLLIGFFLLLLLERYRHMRRKREAWKTICKLIAIHQNTLAQRRQNALAQNHYGVVHAEKWDKELSYFCQTILEPTLIQNRLGSFWAQLEKPTLRRIQRVTKKIIEDNTAALATQGAEISTAASLQFNAAMNPADYERLCSHLLQQAGWNAQPTAPGSDQGVDVIAYKDGIHFVVQCKLYSRPVGNKAVQEIFSARQHHFAHSAAVVSNAGYTESARQLAQSTGVHLLHHSDLVNLDVTDLQSQRDLLR